MIEFLVCKECAKFIKSKFPEDVEWIDDNEQTDPGEAEYYVTLRVMDHKSEECEICHKNKIETVIGLILEHEEIEEYFKILLRELKEGE